MVRLRSLQLTHHRSEGIELSEGWDDNSGSRPTEHTIMAGSATSVQQYATSSQSTERRKDKRRFTLNLYPTPVRAFSSLLLQLLVPFLLGCLCTMSFLRTGGPLSSPSSASPAFLRDGTDPDSGCSVSFGAFRGREYHVKETVGAKCLVESKFVKIQQHTVRFENAESDIPDWIWIDYHERVNVLVQTSEDGSNKDLRFRIMEQTKYALEGKTSAALVGGIVEPGEQPDVAARREVLEEMTLDCRKFVFLGRFRTDVNRGMGWTNGFLAQQCTVGKPTDDANDPQDQVGGADTEKQSFREITLPELRRLVLEGGFMEIQWTAIASLALLRLDNAST